MIPKKKKKLIKKKTSTVNVKGLMVRNEGGLQSSLAHLVHTVENDHAKLSDNFWTQTTRLQTRLKISPQAYYYS